ncbi:ADP-ribosylglycohydrolase family protein [Streptomyces sp. NPDC060209]|uniref:ADP-ribosylglycohydrolase family protein n=1 Tax=Streptomyces sp. NPDC060209 TaxID=3347073 RepID=UPI00365B2040
MRAMNSTSRTGDAAAARRSLEALALGDAFGERWFPLFRPPRQAYAEVRARRTPPEPVWHWTDDTALAFALHRVLDECGRVDQDRLARYFALAFAVDPARGYGHGMHILLPELLASPGDWRTLAPGLFEGGSLGNGAAMRVAPLGARFHADVGRAVEQAALSAVVTHAHPEGVAGAVALAVAAALSVRGEFTLEAVAARTPEGPVREGVLRAAEVPFATEPWKAADLLGNGRRIRADDTVPFALWTAARHPDDLEGALWATADGFGDVDTTCAITGGVVGAAAGVEDAPAEWRARLEPLS